MTIIGEGDAFFGVPGQEGNMPATKAQQRAVNKYMAANYDRINLTVPKGQKEVIKAHAALKDGGSVNAFINRAIDETIERDNAVPESEK